MSLHCLLFSDDERAIRLLRLSFGDLSIEVEPCTDLDRGQKMLLEKKFDAVVSDCELSGGPALLKTVRKSKHNRRSIIFALASAEIKMSEAFQMGADFVIYKPLTTERVKRTINAAHGLMMRERRLHFRHPTKAPVMLNAGHRPQRVELCDLSQHGALIDAGMTLKKGQLVEMHFRLPDTEHDLDVTGRVTRSDPMGRSGVKFESLSEEAEARLMQWAVERSLEVPQPAPAAKAPERVEVPAAKPIPDALEGIDFEVEVIDSSNYESLLSRQRATLRGQHHAAVKILSFDNAIPIINQGKCRNISELGLAATVDQDLAIDGPVLLLVELPGVPKPIVLHACVRRQEDELYGFEFVAVDSAVKELIRECVNDLPVE